MSTYRALRSIAAWDSLDIVFRTKGEVEYDRAEYLAALYQWSQSHKFWRTRIISLETFAKALWNQTEKGLVAQFIRAMGTKKQIAN
jgi:hypothetical protein